MAFIEDETSPMVVLDRMRAHAAAAASGCEVARHERELRWAFNRLCALLEADQPAPLPDAWRRAAAAADAYDGALLGGAV